MVRSIDRKRRSKIRSKAVTNARKLKRPISQPNDYETVVFNPVIDSNNFGITLSQLHFSESSVIPYIKQHYDLFKEWVKRKGLYDIYILCNGESKSQSSIDLIKMAVSIYTDKELACAIDCANSYTYDCIVWSDYIDDPSNKLMLGILNTDICKGWNSCVCTNTQTDYWWYMYLNAMKDEYKIKAMKSCHKYMIRLENKDSYSKDFYFRCLKRNVRVYRYIPVDKFTEDLKLHVLLTSEYACSMDLFPIELVRKAIAIDYKAVRVIPLESLTIELIDYALSIDYRVYRYLGDPWRYQFIPYPLFKHCLQSYDVELAHTMLKTELHVMRRLKILGEFGPIREYTLDIKHRTRSSTYIKTKIPVDDDFQYYSFDGNPNDLAKRILNANSDLIVDSVRLTEVFKVHKKKPLM